MFFLSRLENYYFCFKNCNHAYTFRTRLFTIKGPAASMINRMLSDGELVAQGIQALQTDLTCISPAFCPPTPSYSQKDGNKVKLSFIE